jgi:hypothetical protein
LRTERMSKALANPDTPPSVRSVIQKYLAERSDDRAWPTAQ